MHRRASSDANMPGSVSRTASVSSDRTTLSGLLVPGFINPPPSYVALAAASQIVTDYHDAKQRDELNEEGPHASITDGALFSTEALALLNAFLDYLLYSFLLSARSTSLVNLRPAIFEVLRPRLAREAVGNADEELQELLSSADEEEELSALQDGQDPQADWNLDSAWKRARLRVMVYIRLGEMEDEDEERFLQEDEANEVNISEKRFSCTAGLVSWAAAIFLTSVIEYVAEQTLIAAGQAAYDRIEKRKRQSRGETSDSSVRPEARVVIEESDMEKVALSPALGRLWRTWRKRLRAPFSPARSSYSYINPSRRTVSAPSITGRRSSTGTVDDATHSLVDSRRESTQTQGPESELSGAYLAANIPLPMSDNDVNEIEVPGLVEQSDDDGSEIKTPTASLPKRPWSTVYLSSNFHGIMLNEANEVNRLHKTFNGRHGRSHSLPNFYALPPLSHKIDLVQKAPITAPVNSQRSHSPADTNQDADKTIAESDSKESFEKANKPDMLEDQSATFADSEKVYKNKFKPSVISIPSNATTDSELQRGHRHILHVPPKRTNTLSSTHSSSSSHKSSPRSFTTAKHDDRLPIMHPEDTSRPREDSSSTDLDDDDPAAIGIAHTTNISVPASPQVTPLGRGQSKVTLISTTRGGDRSVIEAQSHLNSSRRERDSRRTAADDERHLAKSDSPNLVQHIDHILAPSRMSPALKPKSSSRIPGVIEADRNAARVKEFPQSKHGETVFKQQNLRIAESNMTESFADSLPRVQNNVNRSPIPEPTNALPITKPFSEPGHIIQGSEAELERLRRMSSVKHSTEEKSRDFDKLVQSRETVKKTLTPITIRETTSSQSSTKDKPITPTTRVKVHPPIISAGSFSAQQLPSKSPSKTPISKSSSSTGTPSKSLPNEEGSVGAMNSGRQTLSKPLKTDTSEPLSSIRGGRLARESRINTESTRDIAEFIRSTGPTNEPKPVLPFVSTKPPSTFSSPFRSSSRGSSKNSKGPTPGQSVDSTSKTSTSGRRRPHMEPRNAAVTPANDTAELIDFIRQGPPNSMNGQQPRIPRTVAPFRTTMDSDDFGGLGERESETSLNPSLGRTSVNSRTGLLPSTSVQQTATISGNSPQRTVTSAAAPSNTTSIPSNIPDMEPTRKRYRVKDPYAIDSDDEDEDLLTALPHQKARKETFTEFLKAMEEESDSRPARNGGGGRGTAGAAVAAISASRTATQTAASRSTTVSRNDGSGGGGGGSGSGSHRTIPNASAAAIRPRYEIRSAGRVPTGSGPRVMERSATSDLADFLRNSGPPDPKMATPTPLVNAQVTNGKDAREGKGGIKFWKRL